MPKQHSWVQVEVNDIKTFCFIDSGSSLTIVSPDFTLQHDLDPDPSHQISVDGIGGNHAVLAASHIVSPLESTPMSLMLECSRHFENISCSEVEMHVS